MVEISTPCAHQAGRVADLLHITPACGDGEAVEIGAQKTMPVEGGAGRIRIVDRNAAVKSYARCFYRPLDGGFKSQKFSPLLLFIHCTAIEKAFEVSVY